MKILQDDEEAGLLHIITVVCFTKLKTQNYNFLWGTVVSEKTIFTYQSLLYFRISLQRLIIILHYLSVNYVISDNGGSLFSDTKEPEGEDEEMDEQAESFEEISSELFSFYNYFR